jgi:hypothetical protein
MPPGPGANKHSKNMPLRVRLGLYNFLGPLRGAFPPLFLFFDPPSPSKTAASLAEWAEIMSSTSDKSTGALGTVKSMSVPQHELVLDDLAARDERRRHCPRPALSLFYPHFG